MPINMAEHNVISKATRKPVRRDPQKRREQNIRAQKKYREKLRGRISQLETLAASAVHGTTTPCVVGIRTEPVTNGRLKAIETTSSPTTLTPLNSQLDCVRSDPTTLSLADWDPTTSIDPTLLLAYHPHNKAITQVWTLTVDNCGCPNPHVTIQTQSPDPSNYGHIRILSFGSRQTTSIPTVSNPYANTLRLDTLCTVAALYALAQHIGATEEMVCAEEAPSPFFRPGAAYPLDEEGKRNTISTVQTLFQSLKPDLRPSKEQITVDHHLYIDLLPFPTLRKNLIAKQGEIDEDEFFMELVSGLVCWGGAGAGRRDMVEDEKGFVSTGTPWDLRSWEAKDWFMRKYWGLLGGEDGELVKQTGWWKGVRGEDMLRVGVPVP